MNPPRRKPVVLPRLRERVPGSEPAEHRSQVGTSQSDDRSDLVPGPGACGGPKAVGPTLAIMAGISILIWATTFTLFSFVSLARIFRTPASSDARSERPDRAEQAGVADRWLDGPV